MISFGCCIVIPPPLVAAVESERSDTEEVLSVFSRLSSDLVSVFILSEKINAVVNLRQQIPAFSVHLDLMGKFLSSCL